jgi:hypothetical protein
MRVFTTVISFAKIAHYSLFVQFWGVKNAQTGIICARNVRKAVQKQ